ncbi:MAG: T9SS type A sorting domain-containing protein, partial [Candidatus Aminicenantes bacterium]
AALNVEPGAIIKIAGEVKMENGQIVSIVPAYNLAAIRSIKESALKLEGATITGVDDDEIGGDTDGKPGSPTMGWGVICMSGNDKDLIKDCTIKYCTHIGGFGSIKIENNHFIKFGGLVGEIFSGNNICDVVLNAAPAITRNTFEMDSYGMNDLSGMSPVVSSNTFLGGHTAISVGTRLLHGAYADEPAGPISGRTEITNNTIENCSDYGIYVWDKTTYFPQEVLKKTPPFSVSIRNNILRNKGKATGIILRYSNNGEVLYNEIDNFYSPIKVFQDERYKLLNENEANRLKINYNKFTNFTRTSYSNDLDTTARKYWSHGTYIDAQHNFWGDASGPEDKSNKDGLYNPFGKGIRVGDGVDYRNFIGGSQEVIPDAIRISTKANPLGGLPATDELVPEVDYTFKVNVEEYTLKSAPTGKITVMVKDETGMILNGSGTVVNVTNTATSLDMPDIDVKIPELARQIRVEASLSPDMDKAVTVYSNSVEFMVKQLQSSFQITGIQDVLTGKSPTLVQDSKTKLRFDFLYNLSGSLNGRLELDLKERVTGKGTVLQDLPLATVDLTPGSNQKSTKELEVDLPMRDASQVPGNELYYLITMKDGDGKITGRQTGVLPIKKGENWVSVFVAVPRTMEDLKPGAGYSFRKFYLVGEVPIVMLKCTYKIEKPNVTNWQIQAGPLDIYDGSGKLLYSYPPTISAHWTGLTTTGATTGETSALALIMPKGTPPIPKGAVKAIISASLIDPDKGIKVFTQSSYDMEVRDPSQTVEKDVAQGQSQVSFDQIPVKLDFKANTSSGKVTAHEFQEQYSNPLGKNNLAKHTSAELFQKFIPLNRYWSVYDSLKEGSFTAAITITYDPQKDFPFTPDFNEDSLVIVSVNPNSRQLEELPSALDKANRTITTDYMKFYDTYIIASKGSSSTQVSSGNESPERFTLYQNYPNPFNPATKISFELPLNGNVKLIVYNILGQVKAVLANGFLNRGEHKIIWNLDGKSSGVYIARLEYNGKVKYIKMVALK